MFALFELLFVVGTIALYIKWILIGAAIWAAMWLVRRGLRALADAERRRQLELDEVRARADQQHRWVMQGDDRGIYGPEGAELMHYIKAPPQAAPTTEPQVAQWRRGPFGTRFAS